VLGVSQIPGEERAVSRGLRAVAGRAAEGRKRVRAGCVAQRSSRTHHAFELLTGRVSGHVSFGTDFTGLQS